MAVTPVIFGLSGWSGSGKTTLVLKVLENLIAKGLTVSTIKHTHHNIDLDKPGKDTYRQRQSGAQEVMLASSARWALMRELDGQPEWTVEELVAQMTPVDLILIEGFKSYSHPKLEVHRPVLGKPLLSVDDPTIVAVASDEEVPGLRVPLLDLNDVEAVSAFILDYTDLRDKVTGTPAAKARPKEGRGAA